MHNSKDIESSDDRTRAALQIAAVFLFVEFLDELVDGVKVAAMPAMRSELALDYLQVGMLIGLPHLAGCCLEPLIGMLGDVCRRDRIVRAGGLLFACAALLIACSKDFHSLLVALLLFNPASGTFVGLSQASLIDIERGREEQAMARWVFCGTLAHVAGPLLLAAAAGLELGWRAIFGVIGALAFATVLRMRSVRWQTGRDESSRLELREALRAVVGAFRKGEIVRTLALLEFADLMLDVFGAFLALYLVDVLGCSTAQAGLVVTLRAVAGVAGDLAVMRILQSVDGAAYLRASATCAAFLYAAFLASRSVVLASVIVMAITIAVSGWYAVLKGRLYAALPESSGTAMGISSLCSLLGGLLPWIVGSLAEMFGLRAAMLFLFVAPLSILLLLPRTEAREVGAAELPESA